MRQDLRRDRAGSNLIKALQADYPYVSLRCINLQADDHGFRAFMSKFGATETTGQYELAMKP